MANHSENPTSHMLDIIRAALPHVNSRLRNSMEVAIKTGELAETFSTATDPEELKACALDDQPIDLEGLLVSIQNVCIGHERDMVNSVLNFYKTRNLYHAYQEFRKNNLTHPQPELQAASMNSNGNSENTSQSTNQGSSIFGSLNSNTLMQFLMTQLNPEQKAAFESMSMLFNSTGGFNPGVFNSDNETNNNTSNTSFNENNA